MFVALGMCLCFLLSGQKTFDLISVNGRYGLPQNYDSVYNGKATEYGLTVNLAAPVKMSEKSMWFNSVNYFYWHITSDATIPESLANPINIHGLLLRTGLVQKLSRDREIQVLFVPRMMSDFKNVDGTHFQLGGIFLFKKKFSEKLAMGFGAMYNQEAFGPYLVPLIDLDWQISDRWSITGFLPVYSKIKYKINERLNLGLAHFGLVTTYRLGDPSYQGDYIDRRSIDVSFFCRYRVAGNFNLEGRFGYALARSYAQYASDQKVDFSLPLIGIGDDRVMKNVDFRDGVIFELRLVYAVPIPEG
jgi:hypothetical protein